MPINQQDLSLRLQCLEAVAGERPGVWSRGHPSGGWRKFKKWSAEHAPDLDAQWHAEQNLNFWISVEKSVHAYMRRSRTVMTRKDQLRNTPEEAFHSILMGLSLGSGEDRDPIFYELGKKFKSGILSGVKDPEDIRKMAVRKAVQKATDELRVSGGRTNRRDDGTDLSTPAGLVEDSAVRQLHDDADRITLNRTPDQGTLYEFLGGNQRAVTRTLMDAIGEGLSDGGSPLWDRMIDVWMGKVPELSRAKATAQQQQVLMQALDLLSQGRGYRLKDVADTLGVSSRSVRGLFDSLASKIVRELDDEQALEAMFDTSALRSELKQVVRLARQNQQQAANRVAAKFLSRR